MSNVSYAPPEYVFAKCHTLNMPDNFVAVLLFQYQLHTPLINIYYS